jgi:hypothetical protein
MPRRLEWTKVGEVSVVDAGANLKGRFPITKGKAMDLKLLEAALETPVEGEAEIEKRGETDDEKQALVAVLRFMDAVGVDKSLLATDDDTDNDDGLDENDEVVDVNKNEDEDDKEMDEAIQKQFEELNKKLEDAEAARKESDERLEKMRDERDLAEWVGKAKENLQYVPGETIEDLAKSLHDLAKVNPELADKQYDTLCKSSAALEKSEAFKAVGTSGRTETTDEARIAKRRAELEKGGMSKIEAFKAAAKENEKNNG